MFEHTYNYRWGAIGDVKAMLDDIYKTQPTPVNPVSFAPQPQLVAAPVLQLATAPIGVTDSQ
uniref:Uncharacterized protein n=1 Tax=Romanomermis culicivorax TaxID=13658 RepID=A0A915JZ11_ROMCU